MVKGISRRVVVVDSPDQRFFEQAIFIVRNDAAGEGVTSRELVEEARARHNTSPVATAALGRLLAGGAMMGSMMKGEDDLLTLKITGDGPMRGVLVTANSHADVKGYVYEPGVLLPANAQGKLDVGGAIGRGTLYVMKDLGLKEMASPGVGVFGFILGLRTETNKTAGD